MPVSLKQNHSVLHGLSNGTTGRVVSMQGNPNDVNNFICIVHFDDYDGPSYPNLPPGHIPIPAYTGKFKTDIGHFRNVPITRTQIPLVPVFAVTNYICQGSTVDRGAVVIDYDTIYKRRNSMQSIYILFSRVRSFADIILLTNDNRKLQLKPWPTNLTAHTAKLQALHNRTINN